MSLFQAWQQWSTRSSYDLKIRFESQLSRMNCHTFSTGLSSGHLGGSAMMVMLAGTTRRVDMCQPAWSTKRTAWAAGATAAAISARCRFIASVLYQPAETLTHRRHRLRRARCQYPIGLPYVFAMDVPVGRRQHESGSASFGIIGLFGKRP